MAVVPRLCTETVNDTAEPTAGFAGLDPMSSTWRSGPGAWATTSCAVAVKPLLSLSCSMTVSVGSTTALTR